MDPYSVVRRMTVDGERVITHIIIGDAAVGEDEMDEAIEPQSIVPSGIERLALEGEGYPDVIANELRLYQIKATEAQTRELAHIGDALGMISNHLSWVAQKAIVEGRLQPPPPGFEEED